MTRLLVLVLGLALVLAACGGASAGDAPSTTSAYINAPDQPTLVDTGPHILYGPVKAVTSSDPRHPGETIISLGFHDATSTIFLGLDLDARSTDPRALTIQPGNTVRLSCTAAYYGTVYSDDYYATATAKGLNLDPYDYSGLWDAVDCQVLDIET